MAKPTTFRATGASAFRRGSNRPIPSRFSSRDELMFSRALSNSTSFRRSGGKKSGGKGAGGS